MTTSEFSDEFDILYNNINSNQAPGLDEYEKSVFLTQAQYDIVKSYFNPRSNKLQEGFDDSSNRQIDFSTLLRVEKPTRLTNPAERLDSRSVCYSVPRDLFIYINEVCKDKDFRYSVSPITNTEYDRLMLKPYQYPVKRNVWRLITSLNTMNSTSKKTQVSISPTSYPIIDSTDKIEFELINSTDVTAQLVFAFKEAPTSTSLSINPGEEPVIIKGSIEEREFSLKCTFYIGNSVQNRSKYYYNKYKSKLDEFFEYFGFTEETWPNFTLLSKNSDKYNRYYDDVHLPANIYMNSEPSQSKGSTGQIELIGRFDENSLEYTVKYLIKPTPIIIKSLEGTTVSIGGEKKEMECVLPEELHHEVLERAVELAKAAYAGDLSSQIALGQSSKTNIGVMASSSPNSR